jgi:serine/threonine-protein phosphatase 2A regulatory subunit B''
VPAKPIKEQVADIFEESGQKSSDGLSVFLTMDNFVKITKEICSFPTFFNGPLYTRILYLWNTHTLTSSLQKEIIWNELKKDGVKIGVDPEAPLEEGEEENELLKHLDTVITIEIFKWFWEQEMEDFDASERFFRLVKNPSENHIGKNDFLPYMKELLRDHPVSTNAIDHCILTFLSR